MKHFTYLFIAVFIIISSCNNDDFEDIPTCENCNFTCLNSSDTNIITNNCIDNWECSFQVTESSKVDLTTTEGKATGDNIVFQMKNSTEGSPMIADDELTDILVFELPSTQNSFSLSDADLANINLHFRRLCFCAEVEFKSVTSGCLQGEQQADGTWFVQGNLLISYTWGEIEQKIDAQFVN